MALCATVSKWALSAMFIFAKWVSDTSITSDPLEDAGPHA